MTTHTSEKSLESVIAAEMTSPVLAEAETLADAPADVRAAEPDQGGGHCVNNRMVEQTKRTVS